MRSTPGSSPGPAVRMTCAGKPPRSSTHLRISSRSVVVREAPPEEDFFLPPPLLLPPMRERTAPRTRAPREVPPDLLPPVDFFDGRLLVPGH